ncbi:uncharacterized protein BXZ73DRAFT_100107 [Epithele typhae]|uniref:uncharacterized protein n=1 Tax=Epithele typhae TaxID=378194 RepID=UPI002008B43F|nr:uncharacterized protein BXZ73DRAFT_100107 [Epithele typhae]KAH9937892.1 hypothetical protein BXZ73DRAFT_100107 [Epithele typhae]
MAAPAEMTARDLSGNYTLNKSLSRNNDEILRAQGVSWMLRKTIAMGNPHLRIAHAFDGPGGVETMDNELSAANQRRRERRTFNGAERSATGTLLGSITVGNWRRDAEEMEELEMCGCLTEGWLPETWVDGKIIYIRTTGEAGWVIHQTWGLRVVDGAKRYVRRIHLAGAKGEVVEARLVYDYDGPL